jgi:hypothetical protein
LYFSMLAALLSRYRHLKKSFFSLITRTLETVYKIKDVQDRFFAIDNSVQYFSGLRFGPIYMLSNVPGVLIPMHY